MKRLIQRLWRDERGDAGAVGNVMRIAVGALIVVLILYVGRMGLCATIDYANKNLFETEIQTGFCTNKEVPSDRIN